MILLFLGIPGAGKTYEAVTKIVSNLALGREVFTDIDGMDHPNCLHVLQELSGLDDFTFQKSFHFLKKDEASCFWEHVTEGSMVVLDEVHLLWNSRDFREKGNRILADWASTHRHLGIDLIMITQDHKKLDSQVRSLANYSHWFRKIDFMGRLFNILLRFDYQCFIYEGEPTGGYMSRSKRKYNPAFFKAYKSYITSDIKELGITKPPNVLNHWAIYASVVVLGIFGYFFSQSSFATGNPFDYSTVRSKRIHKAASSPSEPVTVVKAKKIVSPDPVEAPEEVLTADVDESTLWLPISAYMASKGVEYVMVGRYRLESWLSVSSDKRLVLVDRSAVPAQVLMSSGVSRLAFK